MSYQNSLRNYKSHMGPLPDMSFFASTIKSSEVSRLCVDKTGFIAHLYYCCMSTCPDNLAYHQQPDSYICQGELETSTPCTSSLSQRFTMEGADFATLPEDILRHIAEYYLRHGHGFKQWCKVASAFPGLPDIPLPRVTLSQLAQARNYHGEVSRISFRRRSSRTNFPYRVQNICRGRRGAEACRSCAAPDCWQALPLCAA